MAERRVKRTYLHRERTGLLNIMEKIIHISREVIDCIHMEQHRFQIMTDTHPYGTRSRLRKLNQEVVQGPVVAKKGQKAPSSNGKSQEAGVNNEKKEQAEEDSQEGIRREEEMVSEMMVDEEKRIPNVNDKEKEESRVQEELQEKLRIEEEKRNQLKAEEERIQLQLELEEERRERLRLEELRLKNIAAEEENRERFRIEREKLEHLQRENQLMKERLEQEKLQIEHKYGENLQTQTLFGQDVKINSNCFPPQEIDGHANNGLTSVKCEILSPEKKTASATEKALKKLEENGKNSNKTWRKTIKTPQSIRRKLKHRMLNKLLIPKNGRVFLYELKPGCTYSVHEEKKEKCPKFVASVEHDGKVIAVGQGPSKVFAKKEAAENAIKAIITDMFKKNSSTKSEKGGKGGPSGLDLSEISWAGLASYALYKMFNDWQIQENEFSFDNLVFKNKPTNQKPVSVKKELPPDASKLHPGYVLNLMFPGLGPVEVKRTQNGSDSSVTIGYEIDGKMYTGTATNKKKAKVTAAKAVLTTLFGVKY